MTDSGSTIVYGTRDDSDSAGAIEPSEASATASGDAFPPRRSPIFVLLATASTFGAYVPFWVWTTLRTLPATSVLAKHPGALALFCASPLAGGFVLYALSEQRPDAKHCATALNVVPAVITWIVGLAFIVTSLSQLVAIQGIAIAPAFALAQWQMNRRAARLPERNVWQRHVVPTLTVSLGAVAVGATIHACDAATIHSLLSPRLEAHERVASRSGHVSIESPQAGWSRVASGTVGDAESALELVSADGNSWITIYDSPPHVSLADIVAERRLLISGTGSLRSVSSRLEFWSKGDLDRANRASFELGDGRLVSMFYDVLTVETATRVVEVIAFTASHESRRIDFERTMRSLEIHEP